MPIKTQGDLAAKEIVENEKIGVRGERRASQQEMRPRQV